MTSERLEETAVSPTVTVVDAEEEEEEASVSPIVVEVDTESVD